MRRQLTSGVAALGGLLAASALATPAWAATDATTAAVTSVVGSTYQMYNEDNAASAPTLEIKGTSNGNAATLDLRCYQGAASGAYVVLGQVTTAADGSFDATGVKTASLAGSHSPCVVRAIPQSAGASQYPSDVSGFAGKLIGVGDKYTYTYTTNNVPYDYYVAAPQSKGFMDYYGLGDCGIADGRLSDATGATSPWTFWCNGYLWRDNSLSTSSGTVNQRSGLQIDGKTALTPYELRNVDGSSVPANAPSLSYSVTQNATSGAMTIKESDPIVFCGDTSFPADSTKCATVTSAGVRVDRTITQGSNGRVSAVKDVFVSTNGKAHTVSAQYEQDFDYSTTATYRLPWVDGSTPKSHVSGDSIGAAPAGPGSIFMSSDGSSAAGFSNPQTSLTFSSAPTNVLFYSNRGFYITYAKSVPAGKSAMLTQTYAMGESQAEVATAASAARAAVSKTISETASRSRITSGEGVTYRGLVTRDGDPVAGVSVPVTEHLASGGTQRLGTARTGANGTWSLLTHPQRNGFVTASALTVTSPRRSIGVAPVVINRTTSTAGGQLVITANVAPGHKVSASQPWTGSLVLVDSHGGVIRTLTKAQASAQRTSAARPLGWNTVQFSLHLASGTYRVEIRMPGTKWNTALVTNPVRITIS